ncbi:MAG: hypothetical protein HZB26_01635 [Candidatus Hydrogenedentes bacterium]|nr:hypothetical protein [Candidatus Hydrogenedentota bacterium]
MPNGKGHTDAQQNVALFPLDSGYSAFRAQESALILTNLAIMSSVLLLHLSFQSLLGWPTRAILTLFGGRFLIQTGELLWLSARESPISPKAQFLYSRFSILMHLGFATLVSIVSKNEDTHYTVLLVLPVIAAGFRTSFPATLCVAACASFVSMAEVWDFYRRNPSSNLTEYFEASGTIFIYLLVGLVVWLLASNLRKEQNRLRGAMSELERAKDQLVKQEKMAAVGRLSSGIAHEIRNPIAMIASSLAMVKKGESDAALRDEMFNIAIEEARRLERFTTEFLAYARSTELHTEPTNVRTMLRYVADVARARASEKGIRIRCVCGGNETVNVEPFQIHQALLNLITNALEASGPESEIEIGCEQGADSLVKLYVQNAGDPVSVTAASQLFEPFFTTKPQGTGLGLAIVRRIAEAHGGSAHLELNKPGLVRFAVRIPSADPVAPTNK